MKINCHVHPKIWHPNRFAGALTKIINKNTKKIVFILDKLNPFSDSDIMSRYAKFLEYEDYSERQILEKLPKDTVHCVKIMDLSCMGAGNIEKTIYKQTLELIKLKKEFDILLFVMVDPRRKDIDYLYKFIKLHLKNIAGLAFYPNIGYTVNDSRLDRFYELIKGKAVMIHCTDSTPVYYQGNDLKELLKPIRNNFYFVESRKRKELCGNFAHPHFISLVAEKYRDVNFNVCHFGGTNQSWRNWVLMLIKQPNIYTDVSYTFEANQDKLNKYLKTALKEKILPGDDFYMNSIEKSNGKLKKLNETLSENAIKFLRL